MKEYIGIFRGKQAEYNKAILNILWDNGPLSAWEITKKIPTFQRERLHSLYATISKRLRSLEQKEYLKKQEKKWDLRFKGIIATILTQTKPKKWNDKWNEIFDEYEQYFEAGLMSAEDWTAAELDQVKDEFKRYKRTQATLQDWKTLSTYLNNLMQKGVINFDVINEATLHHLITLEAITERNKILSKQRS